jgi:hypothetical protein
MKIALINAHHGELMRFRLCNTMYITANYRSASFTRCASKELPPPFWPVQRVTRTAKVRALHALGFECGFIVIGVSIVAAVLGVTLLQAFTLEIGFFLFFLPYTMFYNWAYDTLRERVMKRRQQRVTA